MKDFNQFTLKQLVEAPEKIFHKLRWKNGLACPKCGSVAIRTHDSLHHCRDCHNVFSDRSGTIFHSCKLPTDKILTPSTSLFPIPEESPPINSPVT